MDFRSRRHERGSNWTDPEIVELLQLWSDETVQVELESSLRNQRVFDRIANILQDKGIYRTGDQCREKIKKMKLEYRRIKDNHKMRSWKFYDVMDRVLANRPAITYSSLGGAVIAQQVFQSPSGQDAYLHGIPPGAFGSAAGGFLFGHPPRSGDLLDIKCEDAEEGLLNSDAPPVMYYGSGGEQDTDGQSALDSEDPMVQIGKEEGSARAIISPSGLSGLNMAGSTGTGVSKAGGPAEQDSVGQASKDGPRARQRKRRRAGRGAGSCGAGGCGGRGVLDKALVSFMNWQRTAEDRLLSLEEARLEREAQAEERREQQEERRAEQERQHELRLLSVFAGALAAVRQTSPQTTPTSTSSSKDDPSLNLTASNGPSSVQITPNNGAISTKKTPKSTSAESSRTGKHPKPRDILGNSMGAETPGQSVYLSHRGNCIRQHQGILQEGFEQYQADKYHDKDNPNGILNMGTSENKLCYDLLRKRLTQPDMLHVEPALLQYPDWKGHRFLREEVARFLSHYCCSPSPLGADNVVVMNGCGSLYAAITAVICDPEDAILIPTPFYGVITEDLSLYGAVRLFHIHLDCEANGKDSQPFHLTVAKLEEALQRAKKEGVIIRGLILVNPHNPLADIYSPQEMTDFLEFAKRYELHVIVDEVYMLTVFDESVTFHSLLSLDRLPDPQRTHIMWGLSKDFAMAGLRVGVLYTVNRDLVEALDKLASFHGVSGITQLQVAKLLKDRDWISGEFLPENRRRLQAAHRYLTGELQTLGVPYLHCPSGFYVWADFRKYLRKPAFSEELSLWRCFLRHKVVLSCGQAFSCSTPGWFRIVFTDQQDRLQLGVKRIRETLMEREGTAVIPDLDPTKASSGENETEKSEKKGDAIKVHSTCLPNGESSVASEEKDSPNADATPLASDDFELLDCQTAQSTNSLDSLIGALRQQIRSSDWLEKNTPELSAGEDPELLDVFKDLLDRARK
ncbi:1-aminocyclopropane-1-carboxylate synthase-like protein 1 [Aplochiton taeniatus]